MKRFFLLFLVVTAFSARAGNSVDTVRVFNDGLVMITGGEIDYSDDNGASWQFLEGYSALPLLGYSQVTLTLVDNDVQAWGQLRKYKFTAGNSNGQNSTGYSSGGLYGFTTYFDYSTLSNPQNMSSADVHLFTSGGSAVSTTNVTVTVSNPTGSGLQQYAVFYFNGLISTSTLLCPGQSDTESHTCSIVDPVDTFTGGLVPCRSSSTNLVGTVTNDKIDKIVQAYWKYNGNIVKSEYLTPGQSDSYTFNFDLCAGNGSFDWGYTVVGTAPDPASPNTFGNVTNSQGQFANSSPTNGAYNAGTGLSGGNSDSWPTGYIFTNNIYYPTGLTNITGLALDSTLRAGLGQLHDDNLNVIKAQNVLHTDNSDIIASLGTLARTNPIIFNAPSNVTLLNPPTNWNYTGLLTQISSNTFDLNTKFASWSNAPLGTFEGTNWVALTGSLSNAIVAALATRSNSDQTFNFPTNFAWPSNQVALALSNYATESTLQGISNLLGGDYDTNLPSDDALSNIIADAGTLATNLDDFTNSITLGGETNYYDAQAASASASAEMMDAEGQFSRFFAEMSPIDIDDNFGDPDMTYTFDVGGPSSHLARAFSSSSKTIDFNPLHNEQIAPLFQFSKVLWTWGLAMAYMMRCLNDARKALEMCEESRGVIVTSPVTKKTYS